MSFRKKAQPAEVELHVGQDKNAEIVLKAAAFGADVQQLVHDHEQLLQQDELQRREIVVLRHRINDLTADLAHERERASIYIRANGELAATVRNMLRLADDANGTVLTAQALADQLPQPTREVKLSLANGDAPQPTLEEIQLAQRLAPPTD